MFLYLVMHKGVNKVVTKSDSASGELVQVITFQNVKELLDVSREMVFEGKLKLLKAYQEGVSQLFHQVPEIKNKNAGEPVQGIEKNSRHHVPLGSDIKLSLSRAPLTFLARRKACIPKATKSVCDLFGLKIF